jgi:hypothetical protein
MPNVAHPPAKNLVAGSHASQVSTLVLVFRILRWTVYTCSLFALVLLLHKAAPPPVQTNAEAAARAEQKVQDVQQAEALGQPATLRMDETELNSYLVSHLALADSKVTFEQSAVPSGTPGGAPGSNAPAANDVEQMRSNVKDVKLQLIDDHIRAYVMFDVHGKDMTLQLEGKLGAANGFLRFEPVSGQIGALPIPQATLDAAVRRMMESPENRDKLKLPAEISDLKIENGEVVAQYQ